MAKKNPYHFTIGFDAKSPLHRRAAEILNATGKGMAQMIAEAVVQYADNGPQGSIHAADMDKLTALLQDLVEKEIGRQSQCTGAAGITDKETMDLSDEAEPILLNDTVRKNVSFALQEFRRR